MNTEPLDQAYEFVKSGDRATARLILLSYLDRNPMSETAWSLLYFCEKDEEDKRQCLLNVLEINPYNEKARQSLEKLNRLKERSQVYDPEPVNPIVAMSAFAAEDEPPTPPPPDTLKDKWDRLGNQRWAVGFVAVIVALSILTVVYLLGPFRQKPQISQAAEPEFTLASLPNITSTATTMATPTTHQLLQPTFTPIPSSTLPPSLTPLPTHATGSIATIDPSAPNVPIDGQVEIIDIYYIGATAGEADEYVEITNSDSFAVNIQGWVLTSNISQPGFVFPNYVLEPGIICRIYTNRYSPATCGFSFESPEPVWDNSSGCVYLLNRTPEIRSTFCYGSR